MTDSRSDKCWALPDEDYEIENPDMDFTDSGSEMSSPPADFDIDFQDEFILKYSKFIS